MSWLNCVKETTGKEIQGTGWDVTEQLNKHAKDGFVPIMYSTQLIPHMGAKAAMVPGIIHHCVLLEAKEPSAK